MIATKIWGEMTRKVGVSPSTDPPCLRKSGVGGNSQLGASSSIGSQAGSRSPRRESDVRYNFSPRLFWANFGICCLVAGGQRSKLSLVISVGHSIPPPTFRSPTPLALHYIPIKHPPLPLPQHKCRGSKLDRNCGKKGEKQMQPLCSTSSHRKRYTAT